MRAATRCWRRSISSSAVSTTRSRRGASSSRWAATPPTREADLGEALAAAANGVVTAEAKAAFDRALALDKANLKARFFSGMAAAQDGNNEKAAGIWRGMLAEAPPGAPWADSVREALAEIGGQASRSLRPGGSARAERGRRRGSLRHERDRTAAT